MKKQLLSLIALAATGAVQAENWRPQFSREQAEITYIKMAAPAGGDRCGAVTIKPKGTGHNVLITSTIWSGFRKAETPISKYSGRIAQTDVAGPEYVRVPAQGYRARFDWAGRAPQTHYRVYCYVRDSVHDFPRPVNCDEVVSLEDILFNRTCGGVARLLGGTGVEYGDLNMNKG